MQLVQVGNCNHSVPPDNSFDDINDMSFTILLSAQIVEW